MKFYGISDKALQIYQSYLGNRYCRTQIYNGNKNSNKVSDWATVRHGVPQAVAYPGIFFGGGSTNSVEDIGQRGRGSGGGRPLVRGSGGSCNLVQEISFYIVTFS